MIALGASMITAAIMLFFWVLCDHTGFTERDKPWRSPLMIALMSVGVGLIILGQ